MRAFLCLLVLASATAAFGSTSSAAQRLPRSTPEAQGINSSAVLELVSALDQQVDSMHSIMVLRRGHVVAEGWWAPYTAEDLHILHSLSKSFTSTAVGLAVAEGKLSLDDPVLKFFPEHAPTAPSENLQRMRVRDLLIMSTGHHAEAIAKFPYDSKEPLARVFLSWPVEHKPGTFFVYNSPGTYMQSAIVQRATGQDLAAFLGPRLFEPLGFGTPRWERCPEGIPLGTTGLFLRTEDIACFGQLLLQKGKWNGVQLVPAAWIEAATAKQTSTGSSPDSDWDQGYGYQFWRCRPAGGFRADGAWGQLCLVLPEQETVVVLTMGTRQVQPAMDLVWEKLLPALGGAKLEPSAAEQHRLERKLATLTTRGPKCEPTSPLAAQISGRTYVFPANERKLDAITLRVAPNGQTSLIARVNGIDGAPILVGHNQWQRGGTTRFGSDLDPRARAFRDEPVAAIGGWETKDTFVVKLSYYETAYTLDLRLQFGGDLVVFNAEQNVAFGEAAFPQLTGRAQP